MLKYKDHETQQTYIQSMQVETIQPNQQKQTLKNDMSLCCLFRDGSSVQKVFIIIFILWVILLQVQVIMIYIKNQQLTDQINTQQDSTNSISVKEVQTQVKNMQIQDDSFQTQIKALQTQDEMFQTQVETLQAQVKTLEEKVFDQNSTIGKLLSDSKDLNSSIANVDQKIPKIILYGPYLNDFIWIFFPVLNQLQTHPTANTNIKIEKKSIVTLTTGAFMLSSQQYCLVSFVKDKKKIPETSQNYQYLYTFSHQWDSVNLTQEIVVDPGTYLFEIGVQCYFQEDGSKSTTLSAIGFTVKVQELTQ